MQIINIPQLPSGRFRVNCSPPESSGEAFRDGILIPALEKGEVLVNINPKYGMPVSWAEEVFGGLVRKLGADVVDRIQIISTYKDCANEALNFMHEQVERDG